MKKDNTPQVPWYRVPFVWMLIALPLSAVVGGFITLALAVKSDDGLVVDDYYRQGKEINLVLERDRAAAARGYEAAVALDPDTALVRVRLRANKAAELPPALKLRFLHATRGGNDQTLELVRTAGGDYQAGVRPLAPGSYHLQLSAQDWRLVGILGVPSERATALRPAVSGG